jgi:hypothetical protein
LLTGVLVIIALGAFFVNYWQNNPTPNPLPSLSVSPSPSAITPSTSSTPITSPMLSLSPLLTPSPSPLPSTDSSSTPIQSNSPIQSIPIFPSTSPITLYPGEVREYNGQQLSSIGNFYENAIMGTQYIDRTTYTLTISGLVNNSVQLKYEDIITKNQLYKKVVTIYCVEGWQATILWEGILVKDLLDQAAPESNATTVIFHASDGYTTALPKEYLINNDIIIAYKMNGLILPPERGFPFQLVAESKYGYKWIKWITGIELSNSTDYLGYWESRGYSNNAEIP